MSDPLLRQVETGAGEVGEGDASCGGADQRQRDSGAGLQQREAGRGQTQDARARPVGQNGPMTPQLVNHSLCGLCY